MVPTRVVGCIKAECVANEAPVLAPPGDKAGPDTGLPVENETRPPGYVEVETGPGAYRIWASAPAAIARKIPKTATMGGFFMA